MPPFVFADARVGSVDAAGSADATVGPPPDGASAFHLGTFGAGDTIPPLVNTDLLAAGESVTYTITFSDPVFVGGTLTRPTMGDPDIQFVNSAAELAFMYIENGPSETIISEFLPADTYSIVISAYSMDSAMDGFTLSLATPPMLDGGTYGAGDSINLAVGALAAGAGVVYSMTFSEEVAVDGSLTGDNGSDVDVYVYGPKLFLTQKADLFDETIDLVFPAGTYIFLIAAYDMEPAANTVNLTASVTASTTPALGTFGAGGSAMFTSSAPLIARDYDHHLLTLTEAVSLSGSSTATTGAVGFRLYDNTGSLISLFSGGDDSFTDVPIPAGTYVLQIPTVSDAFGGGDVAEYTVQVSAAP